MRRFRWATLAALVLSGALAIPVAAYVAGGRLAGPYAGTRGLATYLGGIYADAASGRPLAWLIVLAPLLAAGAWYLRGAWLRRQPQARQDGPSKSTKSAT